MWNGKKLQMQVLPLAPDTVALRSLDWERDRFDIEFGCVHVGRSCCRVRVCVCVVGGAAAHRLQRRAHPRAHTRSTCARPHMRTTPGHGHRHHTAPPHRSLEKGTTYNAYLIYGETHTALVDASHEKFGNLFMKVLREQLKAAGRKIDYILVSEGCGGVWSARVRACVRRSMRRHWPLG
jgi:hypothetical protein